MKNKNQHIEQFPLTPNAKAGVFIRNMQGKTVEEHDISKPHRDNHCQLMLATEGRFQLNIDFENVEFSTPALICVFPEQVHYSIEVDAPKGWILNFDPSLADQELLQLMQNKMSTPLSLEPDSILFYQATSLLALIEKSQSENTSKFIHKAIHSLLNGLLNLIAGEIIGSLSGQNQKTSRGVIIKDTFSQLVKQHYKTWKQPAQYAAALAVTVAHLNDTVKALTGNPVSVHIQEASILEAKRLLYFTDNSVKEIAHEVGYEEPVYFGKLFRKLTHMTPLEFRKQFRD
ncbi:AraC family transcriptional regulator [Flavobacterium cupreum]|uniref:AraC family transcriptional regulator n=1 Tax=Flavobacterium cupreum TaxID=2133766 RepID=A0A434A5J0_9FLAO|nr:helix-turn-helix transcriptional regulator [Flavobacterium cupreum]RUT69597.1 AraC family transcriptional regulator [Flavobacterium cupreum]